ncbi:hypothetical protein VTO73DRAFT_4492 [Trametes versicolor]
MEALPNLPEDVHYIVLWELEDRSDVSALMRSSRSLYSLCINRLLKMGVCIDTDDELTSFCCFMKTNFLDVNRPCIELLDLIIDIDWHGNEYDSIEDELSDYGSIEDLQGAPLLVPVLGCLLNLRNLTIEACEALLKSEERLVSAFAALTTLRSLYVNGFGLHTYDFVNSLRSSLCKIHIDCAYQTMKFSVDHITRDLRLVDPLHLLRGHEETLEEAAIHVADVTPLNVLPTERVFTRVHKLSLMRCRIVERRMVTHAFPGVRTLEVFWMEASTLGAAVPMDVVRARNITDLEQWDHLEHVYADADSLFMLALNRKVGKLNVALWHFEGQVIVRLHTVLRDIQPSRVVLQWGFWADSIEGVSRDVSPEQLEQLLPGTQELFLDEITHLGLDVGLTTLKGDISDYKVAIARLLSRLPRVRYFSFRLHVVAPEWEKEYDYATRKDVDDDGCKVLADFDDEALLLWADHIAATVQSMELQDFFIMNRRFCWCAGDDFVFEPEDAKRIMDAEGMLWHCPSKIWQLEF